MYKFLLSVTLLSLFASSSIAKSEIDIIGSFKIDMVSGPINSARHHGLIRWFPATSEEIDGIIHPCSILGACECWLNPTTVHLYVNCSYRGFEHAPKMSKDMIIHELDLSGNYLIEAPNMQEDGYKTVKRLNLSNNLMTRFDPKLVTPNMEHLNMEENLIVGFVPSELHAVKISKSLKWLDMQGNPINCDCMGAIFIENTFNSNLPEIMHKACFHSGGRPVRMENNHFCSEKLANFLRNAMHRYDNPPYLKQKDEGELVV